MTAEDMFCFGCEVPLAQCSCHLAGLGEGDGPREPDKDVTIARLTAELEAARADLDWMQNDRNRWQDSATRRHFRADLPPTLSAALAEPQVAAIVEAAKEWAAARRQHVQFDGKDLTGFQTMFDNLANAEGKLFAATAALNAGKGE